MDTRESNVAGKWTNQRKVRRIERACSDVASSRTIAKLGQTNTHEINKATTQSARKPKTYSLLTPNRKKEQPTIATTRKHTFLYPFRNVNLCGQTNERTNRLFPLNSAITLFHFQCASIFSSLSDNLPLNFWLGSRTQENSNHPLSFSWWFCDSTSIHEIFTISLTRNLDIILLILNTQLSSTPSCLPSLLYCRYIGFTIALVCDLRPTC